MIDKSVRISGAIVGLICFCIGSCGETKEPGSIQPDKPCTELNVQHTAILRTHGFSHLEMDHVLIRVFQKNSDFTKLVKEFNCSEPLYTHPVEMNNDSLRTDRQIFPDEELSTAYDWQILIADTLIYAIDSIDVTSEEVYNGSICRITSYRINGIKESGNEIHINHPNYKPQ